MTTKQSVEKILAAVLIFTAGACLAQGKYDFAVYHDNHNDEGAWQESIIAFEHFLDWKGLSHKRVTAKEINSTVLKDHYKVIYFPGGDCDYYDEDIDATGKKNIRDLVSNNGGYIGVCAGAEFACDKLVWQGDTADHGLDLFQGIATGPIDELVPWDDYGMVTLTMKLKHPVNKYETMYGHGPLRNKEDIMYYGGCVYSPYDGQRYDTVATFDGYYDMPGIISFSYGQGRVLLISPHPEIEEDSDRDGVATGDELNDRGSDWNFLWPAADWLLGKTITHPTGLTGMDASPARLPQVRISPNPSTGRITLWSSSREAERYRISVKDVQGKEVLSGSITFSNAYYLDLEHLEHGIYFLGLQNDSGHLTKKIVLQR